MILFDILSFIRYFSLKESFLNFDDCILIVVVFRFFVYFTGSNKNVILKRGLGFISCLGVRRVFRFELVGRWYMCV